MKKILLSAMMATALVAGSDYKYEITPTVGGVKPEGNMGIKDYANFGLRFGFNLDNSFIDQIEVGGEYGPNAKAKGTDGRKTDVTRYFANIIKDIPLNDKFALYGILGGGYEDVQRTTSANRDSAFVNYGLGAKYKLAEQLWLKADAKHAIKFRGDAKNNLIYVIGLGIPFGKKAVKEAPYVAPAPAPAPMVDNDYDKDGVLNDKDLCPNTPFGDTVDANGCSLVVTLEVKFDFNKTDIKDEYKQELRDVAAFLNKHTNYSIVLKGYTDNIGSDKYNQGLSERRAKAVKEKLMKLGVSKAQLSAIGYGKADPVATNETDEGRAQNRRVDADYSRQ